MKYRLTRASLAILATCVITIFLSVGFILATTSHADEPLSPYQWKQAQKTAFEQSEKVYAEALKRNGLLAQFKAMRDAYRGDANRTFRIIFGQYLSWYQTFVGDYVGAHASYSIRQLAAKDDAPSPLVSGYKAMPAIEAIAKLAKGRKAVFFNEAHNVPLTRSLTVQMLSRLRQEGFDYFAAETLYESDTDLQTRGYPTVKSGFYTMEPIEAEMVRTALKLGFKVVAYESEKPGNGDVREYAQAKNLNDRVFRKDPSARLVVNAGYAHIQEDGRYLGGKSMAQHFQRLTGIDPLTIEQTMMIAHPPGTENHPYYHAIIDALHPTTPVIFENAKGIPWSLKPKGYDASVLFPPDVVRDDRPTWLTLGDLREPYYVTGSLCKNKFPCLIEARYADESDDAMPADRLVLDPVKDGASLDDRLVQQNMQTDANLYLRRGKYRLVALDEGNHSLSKQNISIGDGGNAKKFATAGTNVACRSGRGALLDLPQSQQVLPACEAGLQ